VSSPISKRIGEKRHRPCRGKENEPGGLINTMSSPLGRSGERSADRRLAEREGRTRAQENERRVPRLRGREEKMLATGCPCLSR